MNGVPVKQRGVCDEACRVMLLEGPAGAASAAVQRGGVASLHHRAQLANGRRQHPNCCC